MVCILHYIIAGVIILNLHTIWRFLESTPEEMSDVVAIILIVAVSACLIIYMVRGSTAGKPGSAISFTRVFLIP